MDASETKTSAPFNRIISSLKFEIIELQEKIERLQDQSMSSFKFTNELCEKLKQLDNLMIYAKSRE